MDANIFHQQVRAVNLVRIGQIRLVEHLDEAEDDQSVGVIRIDNQWLNNLDEAEDDQSVGDSYWTNQWLNNLDEAEETTMLALLIGIWSAGCN